MRQAPALAALLALTLSLPVCADETPAAAELKTEPQKLSYAVGMEIGEFLKRLPAQVDVDLFVRGLKDTLEGKPTLLTPEQAVAVKKAFGQKMKAQQQQKAREGAELNRQKGEAFLVANAKKEGIVTTQSGLQHEVLKEGQGEMPTPDDKVTVHYSGKLLDGTEFDSSYKRGQPATFPVKGVIPGWVEGLQLMKVGGKSRFFIPSNLAYGERGTPNGRIGPNSVLVFDVELLQVAK